jgi:hypothetical protein
VIVEPKTWTALAPLAVSEPTRLFLTSTEAPEATVAVAACVAVPFEREVRSGRLQLCGGPLRPEVGDRP